MDKRGQAKLIMAPLIRLKEDSVEEDRKFQKLETSLNFSAQTLDFLIWASLVESRYLCILLNDSKNSN